MNKKEILTYETDASRLVGKAVKVVFPKKAEEIVYLIKTNPDIVIRGAGTGLAGGAIPYNSLVIDMNKLDKILIFNPKNMYVYVEAGISVKELNSRLKKAGYEFPIVPSNYGVCTIGGMIAVNSCDNRAMKYGRMRDWVEEIEIINGKAETLKIGKTDLMDFCAMEGITGVILKAKLRIIKKPVRTASVFQSDNFEEVLTVARKLKIEGSVSSIDLLSKEVSKLLGFPEKYNLIIEFENNLGRIKGKNYEKIAELKNKVYKVLGEKGYVNHEDPKFFLDKLGEFIFFLEANNIPYYANMGYGIVHPFFQDSENKLRKETISLIQRMRAKPGKYGIGSLRKYFVEKSEEKIIHRIKQRHDPFNKLNRNKIIDFEGRVYEEPKKFERKLIKEKEAEKEIRQEPYATKIGEELTAKEIMYEMQKEELQEKEEQKTPNEKLHEFISAVEHEEKMYKPKEISELKIAEPNIGEELTAREFIDEPACETKFRLKTPDEELKEFIHAAETVERLEFERKTEDEFKRKKMSKEEEDLIKSVMSNTYSNNKEQNKKDEEKEK